MLIVLTDIEKLWSHSVRLPAFKNARRHFKMVAKPDECIEKLFDRRTLAG